MIPTKTKLEPITKEQIQFRLHYDSETGVFTWKVAQYHRIGKTAGTIRLSKKCKYIQIKLNGKFYQAHRLAWMYVYSKWPKGEIDHINGDGLDNRIDNLRDVTGIENGRNKKLHTKNTSGVMGVCFHAARNKWRARINTNIELGSFNTKEEAIIARKAKEKEFGYHENHGRK